MVERTRIEIWNSWVDYYTTHPGVSPLDNSSALGDILEYKLRRLSRLKYHTTKEGFNKRALMRIIGMALGVHRQITALVAREKPLRALTSSGILGVEGGHRLEIKARKGFQLKLV